MTNSFDDIDRMREELISIDRLLLDIETNMSVRPVAPSTELVVQKSSSNHPWKLNSFRLRDKKSPKPVVVTYQELEVDAEVSNILDSDFHKQYGKNKSSEDILGWEFDG